MIDEIKRDMFTSLNRVERTPKQLYDLLQAEAFMHLQDFVKAQDCGDFVLEFGGMNIQSKLFSGAEMQTDGSGIIHKFAIVKDNVKVFYNRKRKEKT